MVCNSSEDEILKTLGSFPPIQSVNHTPSNVLYYTEGIRFLLDSCQAWETIFYISPIFDIIYEESRGILNIVIERIETGGTKISYYNMFDDSIGEPEIYDKHTFPLKSIKIVYIHSTLILCNEYDKDWFFRGKY